VDHKSEPRSYSPTVLRQQHSPEPPGPSPPTLFTFSYIETIALRVVTVDPEARGRELAHERVTVSDELEPTEASTSELQNRSHSHGA
jgi:hypothetical protein